MRMGRGLAICVGVEEWCCVCRADEESERAEVEKDLGRLVDDALRLNGMVILAKSFSWLLRLGEASFLAFQ